MILRLQGERTLGRLAGLTRPGERTLWSVFSVLWALTLLVDRAKRHDFDFQNLCVVVPALLLVAFPGSVWVFLVLAAAQVFFWLETLSTQITWNVIGHVHLCVLLGWLWCAVRARSLRVSEGDLLRVFTGPACLIVIFGMGYAGLAKLNTDFLDPAVSCGVIYYRWMGESPLLFFLPQGQEAQVAGIWFAVAGECLGPLLLFYRRTRAVGLVLLALVWFGLCLNPRSHYFDFAGLFIALSVLFFSPQAVHRGVVFLRAVSRKLPRNLTTKKSVRVLRVGFVFFLCCLVLGRHAGISDHARLEVYRWVVVIAFVCLLVVILLAARRGPSRPILLPQLNTGFSIALIVPLIFFVNEASVYFGFPHRPSMTMAANLQLTPAESNHLLANPVPTFSLSERVRILRSNESSLPAGMNMPWLLFRERMSLHPRAKVKVRIAGRKAEILRARDDERFDTRSTIVELTSAWLRLEPYSDARGFRSVCEKKPPGISSKSWARRVRVLREQSRD